MENNMKIGVLGAGTWGMALSALLARNKHGVTVWSAIPAEIERLRTDGTHANLPGVTFPPQISYTTEISEAVENKELILFVTPSAFIRKTAERAAPFLSDGVIIVNASKGIEPKTLLTMTEVISDEIKKAIPALSYKISALSGPTHAEEVARGLPTSIVSACEDEQTSRLIAGVFFNSCMRVYTNTDILGVEISGALKNIIALAAGINRGMGFGDNAGAAIMTRGITEIARLGVKMGANKQTFAGLAGIGDLIVTCTSRHSRNNRCGELIGAGRSYEEASGEIGMVVEGYYALEAAVELAEKYQVDMPITSAVNSVIKGGATVREAMLSLMNREMKSEI